MVKFAHQRADPRVVGVQVRVLRHIESVAAALPVPRVVPAADGQPWAVVADGPLRGRVVHVVSYLDGHLLKSVPTDQTLRRTLGGTLARLGRALREFDDPLVRPAAAVGPRAASAAAARCWAAWPTTKAAACSASSSAGSPPACRRG